MHPAAMDARLARLREALASLAARSRFEMLVQLAGAERCVTELAADVGLSQSCTTRHLQALARAGLVRGRRDGRRVLFSAVREHAEL
ncbi:MAG TPA: metalloregulator ArsR/SmtB family transcription factor, partial [Candidatus Eisenbacteria bacterium]|nr:metalloregulator ArsR/SmtB family transcription factor [Candidatus Eisenbacteria bacterium]